MYLKYAQGLIMKVSNVFWSICLCSTFVLVGCGKDKNLDDLKNEQRQQQMARINAISGSYSGNVTSKIDNSNLGNMQLNFTSSTVLQSNSTGVSNDQKVIMSGNLILQSTSTISVAFTNGYYEDQSGFFQVAIPVVQKNGVVANISLTGQISGNTWVGSIEVDGQSQNGGSLYLVKNAPQSNTSPLEVGGSRLEQLKRAEYKYEGSYEYMGKAVPFKMNFTNKESQPEQRLYRIFSPVRQVSVNCNLTKFELNFANASLDDNKGTLYADSPTNQSGKSAVASLDCVKFQDNMGFGWDCEVQTTQATFRTHLNATH
jgi:hypothetical protein